MDCNPKDFVVAVRKYRERLTDDPYRPTYHLQFPTTRDCPVTQTALFLPTACITLCICITMQKRTGSIGDTFPRLTFCIGGITPTR